MSVINIFRLNLDYIIAFWLLFIHIHEYMMFLILVTAK